MPPSTQRGVKDQREAPQSARVHPVSKHSRRSLPSQSTAHTRAHSTARLRYHTMHEGSVEGFPLFVCALKHIRASGDATNLRRSSKIAPRTTLACVFPRPAGQQHAPLKTPGRKECTADPKAGLLGQPRVDVLKPLPRGGRLQRQDRAKKLKTENVTSSTCLNDTSTCASIIFQTVGVTSRQNLLLYI